MEKELRERYALVYDEQLRGGYRLFSYNEKKNYQEELLELASYWADVNEESDYREYLFQKYGDTHYVTDFKDETVEFYDSISKVLFKNNGYDYLRDSGFGVYEITKEEFEKLDDIIKIKSRFEVDILSSGILHELDENGEKKGGKEMKFNVTVKEKLSRVVEIEASTPEEACVIAQEMYFNEEIVLCSEDYDNEVTFEVNQE